MSNLVSAAWLNQHSAEVVVLDASIHREEAGYANGRSDYESGHIPGALFADVFEAFSDPSAPFLFTRPTAEQFETVAAVLGLTDESSVVVYDRLTGAWAARVWWVFRSFGFYDVRVLDGGLAGWTAAGLRLASGPSPAVAAGEVHACPQEGFFVDLPAVEALVDAPQRNTPLVCALRRPDYIGSPLDDRSGHIPGSVSLPYPDLLNADGTVSVEAARTKGMAIGLARGSKPVLYCGGAVNAAGLALALTEAGYSGFTLYDGSLNEWRADPSLPLVVGESPS
jgi:thiosulfate/3-mercaptopyruvate sulfurtransferase